MKTKLKNLQIELLMHLAQYETLDYLSCLRMLDAVITNDRKVLSYAFRPLTKNGYIKKHKDGSVTILAKGRALFPNIKPLVSLGGGAEGRVRANAVSRVAMLMSIVDIDSCASPDKSHEACFVPSACWRKISGGILSTARFAGILFVGKHRLAVYDIADGNIEWQLRAEGSLFYSKYNDRETRATGMLFICDDGKRDEIALRIVRATMWQRKHLIAEKDSYERDRPVKYVRAPIRIKAQYERVYLATQESLSEVVGAIYDEERFIDECRGGYAKLSERSQGDYEAWPYRYFINMATDLLKYVYFFSAAKTLISLRKEHYSELNYAIVLPERDLAILQMYPDVLEMEGLKVFEHEY